MEELNFKKEDISESFRKFNDYSNDLVGSDAGNFTNYLNIFIDFCEHDTIMSLITGQLKSNPRVDLKEWHKKFLRTGGSFIGSKHYELPLEEDDRISLLYQFLLAIQRNDIGVINFCVDAFGKTNYNEMIWDFNENITKLLVRGLGYKLDKIINKMEDRQSIPSSGLVVISTGQGSINQIAIGNDIKQTQITRDLKLNKLIDMLADKVLKEESLTVEDKEDLLVHVKTLKEQASLKQPKKAIIKPVLDHIKTFVILSDVVQKIIEHVESLNLFS